MPKRRHPDLRLSDHRDGDHESRRHARLGKPGRDDRGRQTRRFHGRERQVGQPLRPAAVGTRIERGARRHQRHPALWPAQADEGNPRPRSPHGRRVQAALQPASGKHRAVGRRPIPRRRRGTIAHRPRHVARPCPRPRAGQRHGAGDGGWEPCGRPGRHRGLDSLPRGFVVPRARPSRRPPKAHSGHSFRSTASLPACSPLRQRPGCRCRSCSNRSSSTISTPRPTPACGQRSPSSRTSPQRSATGCSPHTAGELRVSRDSFIPAGRTPGHRPHRGRRDRSSRPCPPAWRSGSRP